MPRNVNVGVLDRTPLPLWAWERVMSEKRIKDRWVMWNLFRQGKDRSPFEGSKYAYRGEVVYAHDWPVGRIVPATKGNFVALVKSGGGVEKTKFQGGPNIVDIIQVECFGVFSKFENDLLAVDEMHQRSHFLFKAEASDILERARSVPESNLVNASPHYYASHVRLRHDMDSLVARYTRYRMAFGMRWLEFPPFYREQLEEIINTRASRYTSPEAVAKRERILAREEAKTALGLKKSRD